MTFDPVQALRDYHHALEARDLTLVESMFAPNVQYESAGLGIVSGRGEIMTALRQYFAEHPDHHAWDEWVVAHGPRGAKAKWSLVATNKTTGEIIRRHGEELATFDGDGCIARIFVTEGA